MFTNHQLEKKLVSYVHNSEGSPTKDFFKVNINISSITYYSQMFNNI